MIAMFYAGVLVGAVGVVSIMLATGWIAGRRRSRRQLVLPGDRIVRASRGDLRP